MCIYFVSLKQHIEYVTAEDDLIVIDEDGDDDMEALVRRSKIRMRVGVKNPSFFRVKSYKEQEEENGKDEYRAMLNTFLLVSCGGGWMGGLLLQLM